MQVFSLVIFFFSFSFCENSYLKMYFLSFLLLCNIYFWRGRYNLKHEFYHSNSFSLSCLFNVMVGGLMWFKMKNFSRNMFLRLLKNFVSKKKIHVIWDLTDSHLTICKEQLAKLSIFINPQWMCLSIDKRKTTFFI